VAFNDGDDGVLVHHHDHDYSIQRVSVLPLPFYLVYSQISFNKIYI